MESPKLLLSNQICFPVYAASKLVTKAYKPYLEQIGLTYPQYLVLLILWEKDGIPINNITEKLMMDTNTVSPLLQRMEKLDLITRTRSAQDQRSVFIYLTSKALNLKTQASSIPDNLLSTLISEKINKEEILALKQTLSKLIDRLSDKPA